MNPLRTRFATYDFLGRTKAYFLVDAENLPADLQPVRQLGHLLFIVDMSGSMGGDVLDIRSMIEKELTLEEYKDENTLASVVSFASNGDLVTHIARVRVADIMKPGSRHIEQIRTLRTRGLTCISQGLHVARGLVRENEITAVLLLSDGFANDTSPTAEKREIEALAESFRKMPGVFVNTIAFRGYADYALLLALANRCSGTCFQAPTVKVVHTVLHNTVKLVAGATAPAAEVPLKGADYVTFVSSSGHKVLGNAQGLVVRGLRPEDDKAVYRYQKVSEAEYNAATDRGVCGTAEASVYPILAYAKGQLAEGRLNAAKYALVATRNQTLLARHARALVNSEVAAFSADLDAALFEFKNWHKNTFSEAYALPSAHVPSVLNVLAVLAEFSADLQVDIVALRAGYKKRGIKRVAGVRQPDGTLVEPWVRTKPRYENNPFVNVSSFDINRNNATCNMLTTRDAKLVETATEAEISNIAGIDMLGLKLYNNYTIVGDGQLNVGTLCVRIGNKRLFRRLVEMGVLLHGNFEPGEDYAIELSGRPLIGYDSVFPTNMLDGVFDRLLRLKVLSSILAASVKGTSDKYTDVQLAELKKHYVTAAGYFSAPSTTEYADRDQALADGVIDTRVSYKIDFGNADIVDLSELYSANEYLARRFSVVIDGVEEKKPKFDQLLAARWAGQKVTVGVKPLSARTKLNRVDDVMFPLMEDVLAFQPTTGALVNAWGDLEGHPHRIRAAVSGGVPGKDAAVEDLGDARKIVDNAIERLYRERVTPLVFYIGATGLVPDEFDAVAMTADQLKEKFPDRQVPKDAADGLFYQIGSGVILSVFAKAEYFSTGKVESAAEDAA